MFMKTLQGCIIRLKESTAHQLMNSRIGESALVLKDIGVFLIIQLSNDDIRGVFKDYELFDVIG